MLKPKNIENPLELTDNIRDSIKESFEVAFKVTHVFSANREKGYYGACFAMPSKIVRSTLSVDREILIIISTFEDQQSRTIHIAKEFIAESAGRLDSSTFIVIHRDKRGNSKLKKWGREQGLTVLPIFYDGHLPTGEAVLKVLSYELFSNDSFDVTGPVADDIQFYGRREVAHDLAKKLQSGQIRSCFGIRKIGKTSILHRVVNDVRDNYECTTILIDAQSDSIFNLNASQLINSLAITLEHSLDSDDYSIVISSEPCTLASASERFKAAVAAHHQHVLIVFDEIDYLTPTSPTAPHWRSEFNPLWRNIRAVYQSSASNRKNLSLLISGVSSKWFAEESIDGVENAALSFVPEEYLGPLPRGAAVSMIRRLGRTAGLVFSSSVAETIADTCADMPFWIRKACSFIHSKVDIGLRPFELQQTLVSDYLKDFVASDGTAMSEVALAHLFRVYPELRGPALRCSEGNSKDVNVRMLRKLNKYGLVTSGTAPSVSGQMMITGLANLEEDGDLLPASIEQLGMVEPDSDYGEWADELAIISRRRNLLERKLRGVVGNFIRFSTMSDKSGGTAKDRVLKCVDANRRTSLQKFDLDDLMSHLFWLELIAIIKKEWPLFDKVFGDKSELDKYTVIVNNRPDAHAKDLDLFDAALHRSAVGWFEDRLARI